MKSESALDNFGKFIYLLQPKTKKNLYRKLERILIKLYRRNMSLLFNQTHTHIYIYIYIYKQILILNHDLFLVYVTNFTDLVFVNKATSDCR